MFPDSNVQSENHVSTRGVVTLQRESQTGLWVRTAATVLGGKRFWFGNLLPELLACSHFPNLFCSCVGSQRAFIIPNTGQHIGQGVTDT